MEGQPEIRPEHRTEPIVRRPARRGAPDRTTTIPATERPAFNLRILRPLLRWLLERHGEAALRAVVTEAGLSPSSVMRGSQWISSRQFEILLVRAHVFAGDDETFQRACAYRLDESYGPFKYVARAARPAYMYRKGVQNFHLVSRVSWYQMEIQSPRRLRLRYTTEVPESHLMCLSRKASLEAAPGLMGLPPARVEERGCVAAGDRACIYDVETPVHRGWLPAGVGLVLGGVGTSWLVAQKHGWPAIFLPAMGILGGYAYALRRDERESLRAAEEATRTLRRLVREEADARLEVVALHQRQREWTQALEEQLAERAATMEQTVDRIRKLVEERVERLRGVSHDISNPLQMLMLTTELLADANVDPLAIQDMRSAIDRIRSLLAELMEGLSEESHALELHHDPVPVAPLAQALGRRLRALVFDRDIDVTMSISHRAPRVIYCDRFLLDRVMDNLLTNAAKYTTQGSIRIRVTGDADRLAVIVRDTGRGIPAEALQRIFRAGGSAPEGRATGSHGVGLSVVVGLLDRVGGRLEVMSRTGAGSVFRVHFPVRPPERTGGRGGNGVEERVVVLLPSDGL